MQALEDHQVAMAQCSQRGDAAGARAHAAVLSAGLRALAGYVDWAPLSQLHAARVVEAAAFFLASADLRVAAAEVLRLVRLGGLVPLSE